MTSALPAHDGTLRILLVEDDEDDYVLTRDLLDEIEPLTQVRWAPDYDQALEAVEKEEFDIALVDYRLDRHTGVELLQEMRESGFGEPVIFVTGQGSREIDLAAMEAGASEYVSKENLDEARLDRVMRYALEQHRLRKDLEAASRRELELKSQLLSHVSHELRTPLTAIHDYTSILLDGLAGEPNEDQREHLEVIARNVEQLESMVQDLLDSARLDKHQLTMRLSSVDLPQVVDETTETLSSVAESRGVELSAPETDPVLPPAYADRRRVRQVLVNLVSNALRHTPEGGVVQIRTTLIDPGRLRVTVEDEGPGVEEGLIDRIFEQMERGRSEDSRTGLGLGLYLCRQFVQRQGGEIWLENGDGGATFHFTLPVFSLAGLLAPVFEQATEVPKTIALVRVELERGRHTSVLHEEDHRIGLVRREVHHCTLPDLDVVLPTIVHGADRATIPVVVLAGREGVDAFLGRVEGRLKAAVREFEEPLQSDTRVDWIDMESLQKLEDDPARAVELAVLKLLR